MGVAAVGAAAGALANRAYNQRNQTKPTPLPTNNSSYDRTQNTRNNRTYTPAQQRNSNVYRSTNTSRSKSTGRRR